MEPVIEPYPHPHSDREPHPMLRCRFEKDEREEVHEVNFTSKLLNDKEQVVTIRGSTWEALTMLHCRWNLPLPPATQGKPSLE